MKVRISLVMATAIALLGAGCSQSKSPQGSGSDQPSSTTISATGSTSAAQPRESTLLDRQGSGTTTTGSFNVPSGTRDWDLIWSFSCPPSANQSSGLVKLGNFAVLVYKGTTQDTGDRGVVQGGLTGNGTEHYSDSGTFSLHIGSPVSCTWAVKVAVPGG